LTRCLARVRWQLAPVCCPGFGHLQWMYCSLGHRNRAPTQALRHRSDELGQAYFSMPEERKRLRYSPGVSRRTRVKARARTSALPKPQRSAISSMLLGMHLTPPRAKCSEGSGRCRRLSANRCFVGKPIFSRRRLLRLFIRVAMAGRFLLSQLH
jgi:hypothetical protein